MTRTELSETKRLLLERRLKGRRLPAAPPSAIPRRSASQTTPLSSAQQRLWILHQMEPQNPHYNMPVAVRLRGALDIAALERTLTAITRRHESLRTSLPSRRGQPVQVIADAMQLELPVIDLRDLPEPERQRVADRLRGEEAMQPFDLERGPLFRANLLRLADHDHEFLLTMHHIVSDAWSLGVLIREIVAHYEGYCTSHDVLLPDLPIQYADFAVWQQQLLQSEKLERQLSYWTEQLDGMPTLKLPTDRQRPAAQRFRGAQESLQLPEVLGEQLESLSRRAGGTLFMTLLAAFKVLLSRYTGQEDVVVGTPIAGRNREEIESLIGFFVNSLVMRTDLSGDPSFLELVERVRNMALEAYAHQDVPFEKLVEELQPDRNLSRNPLFQVMFGVHNAPQKTFQLPGLTLHGSDGEAPTTRFDLEIHVWQRGGALDVSFNYDRDLFEASTMQRMVGHFRTLLEGLVADPEQRISELPLLSKQEQQQLLVDWNRIDSPPDSQTGRQLTLHERFQQQARRTPDAVAMVCGDQQLTYRELNARANQLARHLRQQGVGPEVLVGICLDRSLEMLLGILGVLKAGGAYVPLDPEYPQQRLQFMLQDAQTPVLLTRQHFLAELPSDGVEVICLDSDWQDIQQHAVEDLPNQTEPDNLAYVIYTSDPRAPPRARA